MPPLAPIEVPGLDTALLRRNAVLKSREAGRRCFVIGNGPSLARQDLRPLKDDVTIACNAFWKHPVIERWQPTYYCLADPMFFDGSPVMADFFANLRMRITQSLFIVPAYCHGQLDTARAVIEEEILPPDRTYFVAFAGTLADASITDVDFLCPIPSAQNVVQLSVMLALYLGCSPIYVTGADHDYLAERDDAHFYEGKAGLDRHPRFEATNAQRKYRELMEIQLRMWSGYEHLRTLSEQRGVRIVNVTDGGFLDVFDRQPYSALFDAAG